MGGYSTEPRKGGQGRFLPEADFESRALFRAFLKEIGKRRHDFANIPDNLIDSSW